MRRAGSAKRAAKEAGPRPRRGSPDDTRDRLVRAAAQEIEAHGYFATDSNRIARAAGYAPGTFYKHFADKCEVFIAVHREWVAREWDEIAQFALREMPPREAAEAIVDRVLAHHRSWPRFRASLRALVATEPRVRRAYRASRRRQLERLREVRGSARPDDGLLLMILERIGDAAADGELAALDVSLEIAREALIDRLLAALA